MYINNMEHHFIFVLYVYMHHHAVAAVLVYNPSNEKPKSNE